MLQKGTNTAVPPRRQTRATLNTGPLDLASQQQSPKSPACRLGCLLVFFGAYEYMAAVQGAEWGGRIPRVSNAVCFDGRLMFTALSWKENISSASPRVSRQKRHAGALPCPGPSFGSVAPFSLLLFRKAHRPGASRQSFIASRPFASARGIHVQPRPWTLGHYVRGRPDVSTIYFPKIYTQAMSRVFDSPMASSAKPIGSSDGGRRCLVWT